MSTIVSNKPRIVCLSHDGIDMLIHLGVPHLVVGRPAGERRPEVSHAPSIGGYGSIHPEKIRPLKPDLVIAYAVFQQQQTAALVDAGLNVLTLGHHTISGIFSSMWLLASITSTEARASDTIGRLRDQIDAFEARNVGQPRVRVYFEEWDDPMVVAPEWVSELIALAGGTDVFAEKSANAEFERRGIEMADLIEKDPEVIVASWCGKPVNKAAICARDGITAVDAVKNNRIFEVDGAAFLQPGPGILNGVTILRNILHPAAKGGLS